MAECGALERGWPYSYSCSARGAVELASTAANLELR